MSELGDDLNDIDDAVSPFDSDTMDVDALMARLGRLQKLIAKREPIYTAAVQAYNTALQAAHDQFYLAANEYLRASDTISRICSAITFEMHRHDEEQEEESPGWGRSEEGRQLERWLEIWDDFERSISRDRIVSMPGVKPRKTPLSEMIAALPRRPEDLELPPVGRAIAPEITDSVEASWKRIDGWLTKNAPSLMARMGNGANPEAIAKAEATLGVEFPDAMRASYAVHDGSGEVSLFPSGDYLSLDEMLGQYKTWKELVEEGGWEGEESEPEGPIQKVHYHLKWIPLTHNGGGDHTLIDLAPAEGGKVGQLIDFSHESGPEGIAAVGLAEYLNYLADGLEAGAGAVEETYIEWTRGEDWKRSGYAPIPTPSAPKGTSAGRYFEFSDGTSSKFWELSQEGSEMTTRYGKIGTKGQSTTKSFDSPEKAAAETAKIIVKKVKEGYVEKAP